MSASRPTCSVCGSELVGRSLNICPICKEFDPPCERKPTAKELVESYRDMSARSFPGLRVERARKTIAKVNNHVLFAIFSLLCFVAAIYLFREFAINGIPGRITRVLGGRGRPGFAVPPWFGAAGTLVAAAAVSGIGWLWLIAAIRGQRPFANEERRSQLAIEYEHAMRRGLCPHCSYDVSGLADETPCPECGARRYRDFIPPSALDQ